MSKKSYPCLFGLKEECNARKYVEENLEAAQVASTAKGAKVVEKALQSTKVFQFDDKETAKEIGRAAAEGALGVLSHTLTGSMAQLKPQLMIGYCSICPTRNKEFQTVFKMKGGNSG